MNKCYNVVRVHRAVVIVNTVITIIVIFTETNKNT